MHGSDLLASRVKEDWKCPKVWAIFLFCTDTSGKGDLLYQDRGRLIPGTERYLRHFVYLNCAYQPEGRKIGLPKDREDAPLGLIHDFSQIDPNDMIIKEFREHAVALKTPDERGDNELDKAIQDLCVEWSREAVERARIEDQEAAAIEKRNQFATMLKMMGKPVTEEDIRNLLGLTEEQYEEYKSIVVI